MLGGRSLLNIQRNGTDAWAAVSNSNLSMCGFDPEGQVREEVNRAGRIHAGQGRTG